MKKIIATAIACFMLMGVGFAAGYSAQPASFKVLVNGVEKSNWGDVPPLVVDGRTMLPLKAVGDALGVNVRWDGSNNRVIVGKEPVTEATGAVMKVDGLEISISGKIKGLTSSLRYHEFTITNNSKNEIEFDPANIGCHTGQRVEVNSLDGYTMLTKTTIKAGETIKGVIAFGNEYVATNAPIFTYKNAKIRISDK